MSFIERLFLLCPLFGGSFIRGSTVDQIPICLPSNSLLNFHEKEITSLTSLIRLLKNVDQSQQLCIGNPDAKFFLIRDRRKGKFLDQSGK